MSDQTANHTTADDQSDDREPTPERQAELRAASAANLARDFPPYAEVSIQTRGELRWIARERNWPDIWDDTASQGLDPEAVREGPIDLRGADVQGLDFSGAHLHGALLEQAVLGGCLLEEADLSEADLEEADFSGGLQVTASLGTAEFLPTLGDEVTLEVTLTGADLSRANLRGAQLEKANLQRTNLADADLSDARLWQADLSGAAMWSANLRGASLLAANLTGAYLDDADLTGAYLRGANLTDADLREAVLTGADLRGGSLRGADLRAVRMDAQTVLTAVALDGRTRLGDVVWNSAPLTRVAWEQVRELGDERDARRAKPLKGRVTTHTARLVAYQSAERANRQVATVLREQGLSEHADRFAYRARRLQRAVLWRRGIASWPAALGSLLLDLLAGYGYKPWRSFVAYLLVIGGFAAAYFALGQAAAQAFSPDGAVVFSMTSFHGRGFFPGGLRLEDPVTKLAAFEAFMGLLIEITFIATFTQRFFGSR